MNNYTTLSTVILLTLSFSSAQTFTGVSFNNIAANQTSSSSYIITQATGASFYTYTYTRTGNLDGLGIANDTFSFDLVVDFTSGSSWNSTTLTLGSTPRAPSVSGGGSNWGNFSAGESVRFSIDNVSYTRGENSKTAVQFNGFTNLITAGSDNVTDFVMGQGTDVQFFDDASRFTNTGNVTDQSELVYTLIEIVSGNTVVSNRNLDFSFNLETTVPEPTSADLLGSAGVVLVTRRQRA